MAQHDHHHDHPQQEESAPIAPTEAFDAANQALVDALRLSFRVLKWVMVFAVVLYLCSGLFIVDRDKSMAVQLRFGRQVNMFREGVHLAWPYPIDEVVEVPIALETLVLDPFWLQINPQDQGRPLSDLAPREQGLDPAIDGALLTGDKAIMHLLAQAQYRITDADLYIRNVVYDGNRDAEKELLTAVLKNACVASAARTTADTIWKDTGSMAAEVKSRAQAALDRMGAGITLDKVDVPNSYYPLQVKGAVDSVTAAMNSAQRTVKRAEEERQKTLNEAAGGSWEKLWEEIQALDQQPAGPEQNETLARIGNLLVTQAAGKAGARIQEARQRSEQIVQLAQARQQQFDALYEQYKLNPRLFRQRLLAEGLRDLFASPGVTKWVLPPGDNKQIDVWLNKDPVEFKQAQEAGSRKKAGVEAGK